MSEETKDCSRCGSKRQPAAAEATETGSSRTGARRRRSCRPEGRQEKGRRLVQQEAREMEAVKAKLDAAEQNAAQAKEQLLRMAAEYDNYRKRSTREADQKFNDGISFAVNQMRPHSRHAGYGGQPLPTRTTEESWS